MDLKTIIFVLLFPAYMFMLGYGAAVLLLYSAGAGNLIWLASFILLHFYMRKVK